MKRMFLGVGVVAAMLLAASVASAGGVNLAWDDCFGTGGTPAKINACSSNAGNSTSVGSFVLDSDLAGVTGIETVVDFIIGDGVSAPPPWWEIRGTGSCRSAALGAGAAIGSLGCTDWTGGGAAGGLTPGPLGQEGTIADANKPAHPRAKIAFAVAPDAAADLVAGTEYFAFTMVITNVKTVGTGSCAGCTTPACIVLNSVNVVAGATQNQFLGSGTAPGSNFITYQALAPNCQLVPAGTTTWTRVKQMYR